MALKKATTATRKRRPAPATPQTHPVRRLDVGDPLPEATLEDARGKPFPLSSLRGTAVVVYFYPKDDTPGCTREACAFQQQLKSLARLGTRVVGISPDSAARHAKFAERYALTFTLLVDADRQYAKTCGVLVPKTLYGKTSIGIERSTFLVDPSGVVRQVWRKVKVEGHVEQVLAALPAIGPKYRGQRLVD
jgi:thioredoxin-dependent peroxiredoxin